MAYLRKLESKAAKREEQLLALRTSLAASQAHASNLHGRLISTLDALDVLQQTRQQETDELEKSSKLIHVRYQKLKQELDDAIAERDDMREVVEQLIEKVERTSDYSFISQSRIVGEVAIEPMVVKPEYAGGRTTPGAGAERSYSFLPSLVKSLSNDLAVEREAHDRTKQEAASRIAMLEAQLAHRDAELEAYVVAAGGAAAAVASGSNPQQSEHKGGSKEKKLVHFSTNEALEILDNTAQRNRRLEVEVEGLRQKLEQAKKNALLRTENSNSRPPLHSAQQATSGSESGTPRGVPPRLHSPTRFSPTSQAVLLSLEGQISELDLEVEELRTERVNLESAERHGGNGSGGGLDADNEPDFETILLLEEECIRLAASERSALDELAKSRQNFEERETELQDIIAMLERRLDDQRRDMAVVPSTSFRPSDESLTPFTATTSTPRPPFSTSQSQPEDPFLRSSSPSTRVHHHRRLPIPPSSSSRNGQSEASTSAPTSPSPSFHHQISSLSLSLSGPTLAARQEGNSPSPSAPRFPRSSLRSPIFLPPSVATSHASFSPQPPPSYHPPQHLQRNADMIEKELSMAREQVKEKDEMLQRLRADLETLRDRVSERPPSMK